MIGLESHSIPCNICILILWCFNLHYIFRKIWSVFFLMSKIHVNVFILTCRLEDVLSLFSETIANSLHYGNFLDIYRKNTSTSVKHFRGFNQLSYLLPTVVYTSMWYFQTNMAGVDNNAASRSRIFLLHFYKINGIWHIRTGVSTRSIVILIPTCQRWVA